MHFRKPLTNKQKHPCQVKIVHMYHAQCSSKLTLIPTKKQLQKSIHTNTGHNHHIFLALDTMAKQSIQNALADISQNPLPQDVCLLFRVGLERHKILSTERTKGKRQHNLSQGISKGRQKCRKMVPPRGNRFAGGTKIARCRHL